MQDRNLLSSKGEKKPLAEISLNFVRKYTIYMFYSRMKPSFTVKAPAQLFSTKTALSQDHYDHSERKGVAIFS